jgi:energy-coupling factor transporter ATP-binding protein EcfA2
MIVAENLTYTSANTRRPAITELRVAVGTGEILGFPSPNGVGKSAAQGPLGPYAISPGRLRAIRMRA